MQDPNTPSRYCRLCYTVLPDTQSPEEELCERCARYWATPAARAHSAGALARDIPAGSPPYGAESTHDYQQRSDFARGEVAVDLDRPRWGPGTGLLVWLGSVLAILVIPLIVLIPFVVAWIVNHRQVGISPDETQRQLAEWIKGPTSLLVAVLATILAHMVTIAVCWAVVTGRGRRPFWVNLSWRWKGPSVWLKAGIIVLVMIGLVAFENLAARILPHAETMFDEMLKTSQAVRIATACLAVFSAPLVEEVVYRGVLFAGLRSYFGAASTILMVTGLFAGVHFYQYWGSWATIVGITFLSFTLTIVREKTKSLLPCFIIHTILNTLGSLEILRSH